MDRGEHCLHLHIRCKNCEMEKVYCHCIDGGKLYCLDCKYDRYEENPLWTGKDKELYLEAKK
jgi:hypothetical protein